MRPAMVVIGKVRLRLQVHVPIVISRFEVYVFPFDRAPEMFDESIFGGAPSSIAADAAAGDQRCLFVGAAGVL